MPVERVVQESGEPSGWVEVPNEPHLQLSDALDAQVQSSSDTPVAPGSRGGQGALGGDEPVSLVPRFQELVEPFEERPAEEPGAVEGGGA